MVEFWIEFDIRVKFKPFKFSYLFQKINDSLVEINDESCAVLGSRVQRSWPRFTYFRIMWGGFETYSRASAYLLTVFPTLNWPYLALSTLTSIFEKHEDSFDHQLSLDSPLVTTGKNHPNWLFNLKTKQNYFLLQIRNCQPLDYKNPNCFLEEESVHK